MCPFAINTGAPGSASGIQAARAEATREAGDSLRNSQLSFYLKRLRNKKELEL